MACCKSPSAANNNTKSIFCDLAYITNTHFLIHLSIKIKAFQSLTPLTQLKILGKPYARSLRPSLNLIIYTTHLQKSLKTHCVCYSSLPFGRNHWCPLNSRYWQYISLPASFWGQLRGVPEPVIYIRIWIFRRTDSFTNLGTQRGTSNQKCAGICGKL